VFAVTRSLRITAIRYEIAGDLAAAWSAGDGAAAGAGDSFLMRQVAAIGGGTTEMARNVISERVLGMPREQALDRGIPFRDVPRGASRHEFLDSYRLETEGRQARYARLLRDLPARGILDGVRVGIAHHLGWAVAVTASAGHVVVDRRRIDLIEPGMPAAPVEHEARALGDAAAATMVANVRASALRAASASLDQLAAALPGPVASVSLRAWPLDFPDDIAVLRRPPYDARADSVMYCQVLAECAHARGWRVHLFSAGDVEARAARILGDRAGEVLLGPRAALGPPWTKDHRIALAATVLAS
jgi:hypothetical protein